MNKLTILSLSSLGLLSACAEPFDPGSLLTDTRVLGARVEVQGDPERASPAPGETAQVTMLMASSTDAPMVSYAFGVCLPAAGTDCAGAPLLRVAGQDRAPTFALPVPTRDELGVVSALRVAGIVCRRGEPSLEHTLPSCVGQGAEGTLVTFTVALALDDRSRNENPDLSGALVELDGQPWEALALGQPAHCAEGSSLPRVVADGHEHDFRLVLSGNAREPLPNQGAVDARERLQISHFVNAGELERQFSFAESSSDGPDELTVHWEAPDQRALNEFDGLVKLTLVVRDLRGGIARLERSLCAVR